MKRFLQYLLIIVFFSTAGIFLTKINADKQISQTIKEVKGKIQNIENIFEEPCSSPIKYSIGSIDSRFEVSKEEFLNIVDQAANVWETPIGKNLFEYDSESNFKINLIFDERQQQSIEYENLESELNNLESSRDALKKEYEELHKKYQKRLDNYDYIVVEYKKRSKEYNEEVNLWNKKGGAPKDIYDRLEEEKNELENLYDSIEKERAAINKLAGKTNDLAKKEGKLVRSYNDSVETYQSKYGQTNEFNKGIYDGQKIDIFQFREFSDLRLTLVHEMGHALGISHLENSKSIMYYLMGEQNMNNLVLSEEDLSAAKNVCKVK